jgi:hypothetical protein
MYRVWIAAIVAATFAVACSDGGGKDSPDYRYLVEDSGAELAGETVSDSVGTDAHRRVPEVAVEICQPQCQENGCGPDGCGGSCGQCEGAQEVCKGGLCICEPSCAGKECGEDGCGGLCAECEAPFHCDSNKCECEPDCTDKECGFDGCFGECGTCPSPYSCDSGNCACAYGVCGPEDNLDEVCSGTSLGNCGYWACSDSGCCTVAQVPAPDCCQGSDDCRDCINLETAEVVPCPEKIPENFVTHKCTQDTCGLNNECKHFDKVVFGECNDDDACTADSCAPASGVCTHTPIPDCA